MSIFKRLFHKKDPAADFARHIPVLSQVTQNIRLGIYLKLSKEYNKSYIDVDPFKLAHAVVYNLTQDEEGLNSIKEFSQKNMEVTNKEVCNAARDNKINTALSYEYAGRLMAISYLSGGPFSEIYIKKSNIMIEKATELGIEITNIVSLWGNRAIVNLLDYSKKFRDENS